MSAPTWIAALQGPAADEARAAVRAAERWEKAAAGRRLRNHNGKVSA